MRWFVPLALGIAAAAASGVEAAGGGLSVLYVGPDPAAEPVAPWYVEAEESGDRWKELVRERAPAFEKLLKEHFDEVKTVAVGDYKPAMSAEYDVTILDDMPKPLETRTINGREKKLRLPEDFDRPTITISEVGPFMLGDDGPGWKFQHLCQCLDAQAHDFDASHPLFTTPHAVKPTMQDRPVPSSYRYHATGRNLGKTMPMWRVQTEGFSDGKDFLVGCVIMPGLDDSPDGEVISGGECMKGRDAVAIGRQGNFLHWGFATSPTYMTDEAKLAFVNAIHYINRFAGQRPFVHRVNYMVTRADIDDMLLMLTDEGIGAINAAISEANAKRDAKIVEVRAKKERGEELSASEKALTEMKIKNSPAFDRKQVLEYGVPAAVRERFGENWAAYIDYYGKNRDYLYPLPPENVVRNLDVDEDARSLGIANNDVRLLEKCVELLEAGEQAELARRVLERYTTETFETPAEWRRWLDENRERLFFTEVGGFKFLAAPRELAAAKRTPAEEGAVRPTSAPAEEGVRWTAEARPSAVRGGGKAEIVVRARLSPGWHIYAKPGAGSPFVGTSIDIEAPEGIRPVGQWREPAPTPDPQAPGSMVYVGEARFTHAVATTPGLKGKQTIRLVVAYQACNSRQCLPPAEKEILVEVAAE